MYKNSYLYSYNYDTNESELCKLEAKYLFQKEEQDKLLFSEIEVEPSSSAFIKKRLHITLCSEDYSTLIQEIKAAEIKVEGFKVEYLVLDGDKTEYKERLKKLKDIGYSIEGIPDYYNPTITYALTNYNGTWLFGVLVKNSFDWHKHKQKPFSYSNSIGVHIAKSLLNIATKGNKATTLIDACCGVGTIMLEACFAGYNIEGCDINWKVCRQSRANLAHFNYTANVYRSDINDITTNYDAAIIDLPYNLFSCADEDTLTHIIESTTEITDKLVIVSTIDISEIINKAGLKIVDHCTIQKRRMANFARQVWVCQKLD
ncbi:SAM-dependent methyltransferase [Prolixibacteraceae bacterium JC049]|nr:SAM-dependent methyltransferase [Prolixibacteraceae bacterium JC049]